MLVNYKFRQFFLNKDSFFTDFLDASKGLLLIRVENDLIFNKMKPSNVLFFFLKKFAKEIMILE